ncbi:hypothetical protein BST81_09600 [Leptolyngbya sp. 'hensonii']|uniref:iron uptake porin n=1 Tax=Leptolyngbya sp. 'hensonii' TaxID=1922337 RepID=UPI000950022A|nr:iron uptake porin [Leptolyngbya sp. 'hensonii']OLP18543.1 hypothetical protein BST81_09600 [Leptolyngbya sp. 'hensonii']
MNQIFWKSLLVSPAILGAALFAPFAQAQVAPETQVAPAGNSSTLNQIEMYKNGYTTGAPVIVINSANQLTSVNQLSDVQPTDWAFQALQSLVERYGCVVGYPDGTYRGNRAMTRYEFAAGLNSCMDRVNELIKSATANLVTQEDLELLKRLQEEFAAELETLRGRVDALEARTAKLEAQQFSTTTKLRGEVIFAVADAFGDASEGTVGSDTDRYNTTFGYRVRLNFDTSFTGTDRLRTRLQAGNIIDANQTGVVGNSPAPGREGRFGFATNTGGTVVLDALEYRFTPAKNLTVYISANAREYNDLVDVNSPFEPSESGALSRFGRFNPIYRTGNDKGVAFRYKFSDFIGIEGGYLAGEANDPSPNNGAVAPNVGSNGLFAGDYALLGQLVINPQPLKLVLTYVNGYNDSGLQHGTGSRASNLTGAVSYNSYGASLSFRLSKEIMIGGWGGYTAGRGLTAANGGDAEVYNWAGYIAFYDLGGKGNLGGIIVGQQPKLSYSSTAALAAGNGLPAGATNDRDYGIHIEALYRYQVSDNVAITPGFIYLSAPNHTAGTAQGPIYIGVLRTTFSF